MLQQFINPKDKKPASPFKHFYFRGLLSLAGALTLAFAQPWPEADIAEAFLMVFLIVFTLISHQMTKSYTSEALQHVTPWLRAIDAVLIGLLLNFIDFNLVACLLFVSAIQFNALLMGGFHQWTWDTIATLLGACAGFLLHQPVWVISQPLEITSLSLLCLAVYFCLHAYLTHKHIKRLQEDIIQISITQQSYRLRAYKLSRYLPPPVWDAIDSDNDKQLKTARKCLTIFFSDIKGFSRLSEELEAESLTDLLNTYLTEMSKIVNQYGGTIDKFIGDALMIIFGDTNSKGTREDAVRCVSMAIAMKKKMNVLQQQWTNQGVDKPLQIRMGINTGYCTVGTFGTAHHLDYTVLGTHVNLASRLESAAVAGEILISYETWSLVKDTIMCRDKGRLSAKGFSQPVKVYQVIDFRKNLGKDLNYMEENHEGFSLHLDLDKIRNYDKARILASLEKAASQLKKKVIL